jgi:hypothetical protein
VLVRLEPKLLHASRKHDATKINSKPEYDGSGTAGGSKSKHLWYCCCADTDDHDSGAKFIAGL